MMTMNEHSARLLIGAWLLMGQFPSPSEWTRADLETVRLAPARFAALPSAIRSELDRRGCSIPQPFTAKADQPENAIRGHFISPAATDWAVLCSRQRRSSVLIFRGGGVSKIDELAAGEDAACLQVTGPGEIGYSRGISVASPRDIREHNRNPDQPLPVLNHDGINDAFIGKASVIWYWSGNQWLQLAGADAPTLRSNMLMERTRR
jgi:hypothetical protein